MDQSNCKDGVQLRNGCGGSGSARALGTLEMVDDGYKVKQRIGTSQTRLIAA